MLPWLHWFGLDILGHRKIRAVPRQKMGVGFHILRHEFWYGEERERENAERCSVVSVI